jgi:hypothetical protein
MVATKFGSTKLVLHVVDFGTIKIIYNCEYCILGYEKITDVGTLSFR